MFGLRKIPQRRRATGDDSVEPFCRIATSGMGLAAQGWVASSRTTLPVAGSCVPSAGADGGPGDHRRGGTESTASSWTCPTATLCFVKAYPAETTEAFLDGHVSAFAFLGGAPQSPHHRDSQSVRTTGKEGLAAMTLAKGRLDASGTS